MHIIHDPTHDFFRVVQVDFLFGDVLLLGLSGHTYIDITSGLTQHL